MQITKKENVYYRGSEPLDLPRVSFILKGNIEYITDKMAIGSEVHDIIYNILEDSSIIESDYFKEMLALEDEVALKSIKIFSSLKSFFKGKKIDLDFKKETSFLKENEGLGYVGTCDLIFNIDGEKVVVDLKTGAVYDWHELQLTAYLEGIGASYGVLIYEDSYKVVKKNKTLKDRFQSLVKAYYEGNLKQGKIFTKNTENLDELADKIVFAKNQVSFYEKKIDSLKKELIEQLEFGKNYESNNLLAYWVHPSDSVALKKEAKEGLFEAMPHLFEVKKTKGSLNFKIKNKE
jgi:hypothetical protein